MLKWFSHYFKDRKISVRLNKEVSSAKALEVGAYLNYGAVLSPVFFTIMISDLLIPRDVRVVSYADYITLPALTRPIPEEMISRPTFTHSQNGDRIGTENYFSYFFKQKISPSYLATIVLAQSSVGQRLW